MAKAETAQIIPFSPREEQPFDWTGFDEDLKKHPEWIWDRGLEFILLAKDK